MRRLFPIVGLVCIVVLLSGCSVMSKSMRNQVGTMQSFEDVINAIPKSIGSNVIFGGYVLDVTNAADKSTITLVQAPLGIGDEPGSRDKSKGRLVVEYQGFMDPEVYTRDRKVTVGGRILHGAAAVSDQTPYPYLRIDAQEVYLWPVRTRYHYDPWLWDHPYYHRHHYWSYWRHPYYRLHYW